MSEDGHRTFPHRVCFYDLLSYPESEKGEMPALSQERSQEGPVGEEDVVRADLSIPLAPGVEAVWAPNGYGKTFAMKLLEKIRFPDSHSAARLGSRQYWLGRFLLEARREVIEPGDQMSREDYLAMNPVEADIVSGLSGWRDGEVPKMLPFSKMMVRFVTLDESGALVNVEDLWLDAEDWFTEADPDCTLILYDYLDIFAANSALPENISGLVERGLGARMGKEAISNSAYRILELEMDRELFGMINAISETAGIDISKFNEARGGQFPELRGLSFMPSPLPSFGGIDGWEIKIDPVRMGGLESQDFSVTRYWELLDELRKTRVKYVEIPKECHGPGEDPLQSSQELISSLVNAYEHLDLNDAGAVGYGRPSEEFIQQIFDRINQSIMTGNRDPWARSISPARNRGTDALEGETPMRFERPMFGDYVHPYTLSFGQRSAIVLECWLGYLEILEGHRVEGRDGGFPAGGSRFCLVIDEPECGRSEHSVSQLSDRLVECREWVGTNTDNSLIVMSHRRDLLEAVGDGGRFHLLQHFDETQMGLEAEE